MRYPVHHCITGDDHSGHVMDGDSLSMKAKFMLIHIVYVSYGLSWMPHFSRQQYR